ncbi:MAG: hypothetical protein JNM59_11475 [Hyphomonadaceae bacterium]|nr:hypothetical protein [Hyphomonadaceae bacterium]
MRDPALTYALVALSAALMAIGFAGAWLASNLAKRLTAQVLTMLGALMVCVVIGASQALMLAGGALIFGYALVGVAVLVRLQEAYGTIELQEIDAADAQAEAQETTP